MLINEKRDKNKLRGGRGIFYLLFCIITALRAIVYNNHYQFNRALLFIITPIFNWFACHITELAVGVGEFCITEEKKREGLGSEAEQIQPVHHAT